MENYGLSIDKSQTRSDLRIPSLSEFIRVCKKYGKVCVIELKGAFTPEQGAQVVEEIKALDYLDGVVFISNPYKKQQDDMVAWFGDFIRRIISYI